MLNVSFQACIKLIDHGQIDDHLNPVRNQFFISMHAEELNLKIRAALTPEAKKINPVEMEHQADFYECFNSFYLKNSLFCDKRIANDFTSKMSIQNDTKDSSMNGATNSSRYLFRMYSIEFQCCKLVDNIRGAPNGQEDECLLKSDAWIHCFRCSPKSASTNQFTLGMLSQHEIFQEMFVESFMYYNHVALKFTVKFVSSFLVKGEDKMNLIRHFHNHVLDNVMLSRKDGHNRKEGDGDTLPGHNQYFIVPLASSLYSTQADYSLMQHFKEWSDLCAKLKADYTSEGFDLSKFSPNTAFPSESDQHFIDSFDGSLSLYTAFHNTEKKDNIVFIKQKTTILPTNSMDQDGPTYEEFYLKRHSYKITQKDHPLISVGRVRTVVKHFDLSYKPKRTSQKNSKKKDNRPYFLYPLELMIKYPLTKSMFHTLAAFPVVFYRLHQYCIGYALMKRFQQEKTCLLELKFDTIVAESLFHVSKVNSLIHQRDSSKKLIPLFLQETNDIPLNPSDFGTRKMAILEKIERMKQVLASSSIDLSQINLDDEVIGYGQSSIGIFSGNIDLYINMHFDKFRSFKCPHPWHIVRALTLKRVNDLWSMEQMETVGDSYLKMSTALYLYFAHTDHNEHKLQQLKDAVVCNENLFKLGLERQMPLYIFSDNLSDFNVKRFDMKGVGNNSTTMAIVDEESNEESSSSGDGSSDTILNEPDLAENGWDMSHVNKHYRQRMKNKNIADCMEALIGTYIIHGTLGSTIELMRWMGLPVFEPEQMHSSAVHLNPVGHYQKIYDDCFATLSDDIREVVKEKFNLNIQETVDSRYEKEQMSELETILNYKFNNKYHLGEYFVCIG